MVVGGYDIILFYKMNGIENGFGFQVCMVINGIFFKGYDIKWDPPYFNCYAYCTHQRHVPAFLVPRVCTLLLFHSVGSCIIAVHVCTQDRCVCTYRDNVFLFSRWKLIISCYWSVSCVMFLHYYCHCCCSFADFVEEGNL